MDGYLFAAGRRNAILHRRSWFLEIFFSRWVGVGEGGEGGEERMNF